MEGEGVTQRQREKERGRDRERERQRERERKRERENEREAFDREGAQLFQPTQPAQPGRPSRPSPAAATPASPARRILISLGFILISGAVKCFCLHLHCLFCLKPMHCLAAEPAHPAQSSQHSQPSRPSACTVYFRSRSVCISISLRLHADCCSPISLYFHIGVTSAPLRYLFDFARCHTYFTSVSHRVSLRLRFVIF